MSMLRRSDRTAPSWIAKYGGTRNVNQQISSRLKFDAMVSGAVTQCSHVAVADVYAPQGGELSTMPGRSLESTRISRKMLGNSAQSSSCTMCRRGR
jgi:hypothetical protein